MQITPHPFELTFLDAAYIRKEDQQRGKGLHVSQVIRDIMDRVIMPGKREDPELLDAAAKTQMGHYVDLGFNWERLIELEYKERMLHRRGAEVERQSEHLFEGLLMTPDGLSHESELVLEEYKATWKSAAGLSSVMQYERDFYAWMMQTSAYCKMFGITRVRLIVLWVNGSYRPPKPCAMRYEIEYTQAEIDMRWRTIQNHAQWMREEGMVSA